MVIQSLPVNSTSPNSRPNRLERQEIKTSRPKQSKAYVQYKFEHVIQLKTQSAFFVILQQHSAPGLQLQQEICCIPPIPS